MNYRLYIGNKNYSSWSLRPWLAMTECGIAFHEELVPFDDGDSWAKFRAFSPSGLVPCLYDGDTFVWESLAIVEYLYEKHPQVWPAANPARTWARSASAEMHAGFSNLRNQCPMTVGQRITLHRRSAGLERDLQRMEELWVQGLEKFGGPFLAGGSFTAVDAFFAPVVFRMQTFGLANRATAPYCQTMLALDGMVSWTQAAHTETWREPSHEAEIAALGTCHEDLRGSS